MIVRDQTCIEHVREQARGLCECCFRPGQHVHHIWAKGMGGYQIDLPINQVFLCVFCHVSHHAGNAPSKLQLLGIVERREGWTSDQIEEEIYRVRQLPKGAEYSPTRPFATYHRYRRGSDGLQRDPDPPGVGCGRQGVAFDQSGWFRLA